MYKEEICVVKSPCREDMVVHGYRFGKGEQSACILGSVRGNEMQQMYICSQLVRALKELEANGCINAGKSIMDPRGQCFGHECIQKIFWR